jgi:hypothetical protein
MRAAISQHGYEARQLVYERGLLVRDFALPWSSANIMVQMAKASPTGEINKACQHLAKLRMASLVGERDIASLQPYEVARFLADVKLVEDWRGAHAGPLRNANANLRHYIRPHSAGSPGIVSVTQRLKKFSTILDKQCRLAPPAQELEKRSTTSMSR